MATSSPATFSHHQEEGTHEAATVLKIINLRQDETRQIIKVLHTIYK